jgi:hypothetical protein
MRNVCGGYHPFSGTLISSGCYLHVFYNTGWYLGECISSIAHEIARLLCFRRRFPHWTSSWLVIGGALTEESNLWSLYNIVIYTLMRSLHSQTWPASFYYAAGLGALSLVLGMLSIDWDIPSTETDRRCDWLRALHVFVLVVFVLSDGEMAGWSTSCDSHSHHFVICLQCNLKFLFL